MRHLPLLMGLVLSLGACEWKVTPTVSTGGREIAANGVTYVVQWESGGFNDATGFEYNGESVTASEKGGALTVDGKSYGTIKSGDTVDLTTKGKVLVNGQARQPK